MKQYYKKLKGNKVVYWYGDISRARMLYDGSSFIIPLGTCKPKNVSRETIKLF